MKGAKKLLSGESLGAALAGSGPPAASTRSKKEQTQAVSSSEEILDEQDHSDETMTSPIIESGAGHYGDHTRTWGGIYLSTILPPY